MITRDDFKKLKQLDRIEYLLHLKRIEEKNDSFFIPFAYMFFFVLGFLLLFFIGMSNLVGIEKAIPIFNTIILIIQVGGSILIFTLLLDVIFWLRRLIWKKQLREEYFKTETKPKK